MPSISMKITFRISKRILSKRLHPRKQLISTGMNPIVSFVSMDTMIVYPLTLSDPHHRPRTANHISWYPDGARKIAVSYCNLEFQSANDETFIDSYIWDIGRVDLFISSMTKHPCFLFVRQKILPNRISHSNQFLHWSALNSIRKTRINWSVVATTDKFVRIIRI